MEFLRPSKLFSEILIVFFTGARLLSPVGLSFRGVFSWCQAIFSWCQATPPPSSSSLPCTNLTPVVKQDERFSVHCLRGYACLPLADYYGALHIFLAKCVRTRGSYQLGHRDPRFLHGATWKYRGVQTPAQLHKTLGVAVFE